MLRIVRREFLSWATLIGAVVVGVSGGCNSGGPNKTGAAGATGAGGSAGHGATASGGAGGHGITGGTSGGGAGGKAVGGRGSAGAGGTPAGGTVGGGGAAGTAGGAGGLGGLGGILDKGGTAGKGGVGGIACVPVNAGNALAFDNTAQPQYVTVPDAPTLHLATAMTVEAWVSILATNFNCIVCKPYGTGTQDSFAIWFQGGPLFWGLNVPTTSGALSFAWSATNGTWHHLAATFDSTTQKQQLYVDGTLAGMLASGQGSPLFDSNPLLIGTDTNGGPTGFSLGFKGTIDEVRIFAAARTAEQIATDMTGACSPVNDPTLVAYYPFDEGSGTIAHDASSNHLDGTLGNLTVGTAASPTWTPSTVPF